MYQESIFYDLYSNQDDCDEDNSYTFQSNCKYKDKSELEEDVKIPDNDTDIDDDDKLDEDDEKNDPNADDDYSVDNEMKRD